MTYRRRPEPKQPNWKIHPIWRGIGCAFIVLIPILSYAIAVLFVQANARQAWIALPREFLIPIDLPYIGTVPHLFATLTFTVIVAVVLFSIFTIFYALLFRIVGPPQYGPLDAPPPKRKKTKKKRR